MISRSILNYKAKSSHSGFDVSKKKFRIHVTFIHISKVVRSIIPIPSTSQDVKEVPSMPVPWASSDRVMTSKDVKEVPSMPVPWASSDRVMTSKDVKEVPSMPVPWASSDRVMTSKDVKEVPSMPVPWASSDSAMRPWGQAFRVFVLLRQAGYPSGQWVQGTHRRLHMSNWH